LTVNTGLVGIRVEKQGALQLTNVRSTNNAASGIQVEGASFLQFNVQNFVESNPNAGIIVTDNSVVVVTGTLSIAATATGFGVNMADSSSWTQRKNAAVTCTTNLFGFQATGSSSVFINENASLDTSANQLIGLSVNVGATITLFRGSVTSSDNGLDGASITVDSTLFIDQASAFVCNNNNRHGLRVEQSTVRINNVGGGPGPLIETKNNQRSGTSIGRASFLDLNSVTVARGLQSSNNNLSNNPLDFDLLVDFGSSSMIRWSILGKVAIKFGSRVDFVTVTGPSTVASLVCDTGVDVRNSPVSCSVA
jgi:hypothetical protein